MGAEAVRSIEISRAESGALGRPEEHGHDPVRGADIALLSAELGEYLGQKAVLAEARTKGLVSDKWAVESERRLSEIYDGLLPEAYRNWVDMLEIQKDLGNVTKPECLDFMFSSEMMPSLGSLDAGMIYAYFRKVEPVMAAHGLVIEKDDLPRLIRRMWPSTDPGKLLELAWLLGMDREAKLEVAAGILEGYYYAEPPDQPELDEEGAGRLNGFLCPLGFPPATLGELRAIVCGENPHNELLAELYDVRTAEYDSDR